MILSRTSVARCLPGLDGWQLAHAARDLRPGLPILYIPAFDESRAQQVPHSVVLPKAFSSYALATAVRRLGAHLRSAKGRAGGLL
jgi:hypothetical protein